VSVGTMKTLFSSLILILLSVSSYAQADWDYGDPSLSGYYVTMSVDNDEYASLIGPDTGGWIDLRRNSQTLSEFRTALVRIVDALEDTRNSLLKAKKRKKRH